MSGAENGVPTEKKRLSDLRVIDLKSELEKRGLDKSGNKAQLMERLEAALLDGNQDPEEFLFEIPEAAKGAKKPKPESGVTDAEEQMDTGDAVAGEDEETKEDAPDEIEDIEFIVDDEAEITTLSESVQDSAASKEQSSGDGNTANGAEEEMKIPRPDQVEPQCPFTVEDTIQLHAAAHKEETSSTNRVAGTGSDSISMIVHPEDETMTEREADGSGGATLVESQSSADNSNSSNEEKDGERNAAGEDITESPKEEPTSTVSSESERKTETSESKAEGTQNTNHTPQSDKKESAGVEKDGEKSDDVKKTVKSGSSTSGKSLWISNLSQATKATDLKSFFSKYGRVTAAKIVTSKAQGSSGAKYYGMVSMSTADEAAKCVTNLHRTDFKGKSIEIERKQQPERLAQKPGGSSSTSKTGADVKSPAKSEDKKSETEKKEGESGKSEERKKESSRRKDDRRSSASTSRRDHRDRRDPPRRGGDDRRRITGSATRRPVILRQRPRPPPPLMTRGIAPPRRPVPYQHPALRRHPPPILQPQRNSQLEMIELERKRTEFERAELLEKMKQKEMEHHNREEQLRLQREKERLKFEREKLEREKLELQQLKMTQQAVTAYAYQSPAASLPTGRRYEADTGVQGTYQFPPTTGPQAPSHSSSKERSRDRSSRRERSDYHHSSGSGRGSQRQSREGGHPHPHQSSGSSTHHSHATATGYRGRGGDRSSAPSTYRSRESYPSGGRERHQRGSPPRRSTREVTITTPHFSAPNTSWNGQGRRSDFGPPRNAGTGAANLLQGGYNARMGGGTWNAAGQEPQIPMSVTSGTWARPSQGGVAGVAGVLAPDVLYSGTGGTGQAAYGGNTDRFDAYKYSSRRY